MPGDPKECRQHAERCAELARLASTPEARDTFLSLQMTWIDNYCAQHPGHSLTVAAKALVNELTEKATP